MSRPRTKEELLNLSQKNFVKLTSKIDSLPDKITSQEFPTSYLNRNIRDVLGHIHHWHLLFLAWYKIGMSGEKPQMPAPGYTWKTTPELNQKMQERYASVPLNEVKKELET